MQVSIENVGKLGRKLTVRLPAQELEDKVRSRIQETGRSARLKGFRPGKVPTKVIEQRFGRQIRGEVLSEMIGSSFQQAVTQEKLRPAVQPAIQTTGTPTNGEIEYTATFEVMPEVGKIDRGVPEQLDRHLVREHLSDHPGVPLAATGGVPETVVNRRPRGHAATSPVASSLGAWDPRWRAAGATSHVSSCRRPTTAARPICRRRRNMRGSRRR